MVMGPVERTILRTEACNNHNLVSERERERGGGAGRETVHVYKYKHMEKYQNKNTDFNDSPVILHNTVHKIIKDSLSGSTSLLKNGNNYMQN